MKEDKTALEAFQDLNNAWNDLKREIFKALKIPEIAEWVERQLRKVIK